MTKDIVVKINSHIVKSTEKLLAKAIAEIVASRINGFPIQDRRYILDKVIKDIELDPE